MDATQATQSLPDGVEDGDEEVPREKVWGRLISLNPTYPNVELTGFEVVLGRQSCCNVQYNDNLNISGKHCRIFREPSVNGSVIAFIQDMSTNGTYVNNEKLGKGNRLLLSSGFEIALVLNKKKIQDKVAYIFQECAEDKPQEEGGPQKKYDIREALGAGNFAVVKLAINKATGSRFAVKIIDKKKYFNQAGSRKEALMDEVKILRSLNHKHIIHIEEVFDTEKTLYLVLELVEGGDLSGDISREGHYSEEKAREVFDQMVGAISFLHDEGIAHRDLKPENILLKTYTGKQNEFDIKLSDFGLSRTIGEGSFMKTMCGTPQYLAPEIITSGGMDGYGKEVDMWSAGAILYVLLCGYPPFDDNRPISIFEQIKRGLVEFPDAPWATISPSAKDLIKRLLTVNPSRRYTAKQTREHPWMKGQRTLPDDFLTINPLSTEPEPPSFKTPQKPSLSSSSISTPTPTKQTPTKPSEESSSSSGEVKEEGSDEKPQVGSIINYNKTLNDKQGSQSPKVNTPTPPSNRNLVSLESEKNLQSQMESANLGDKRKRPTDGSEDEEETIPLSVPLTAPLVAPSPPVPKKIKKSNTSTLDDEEEEEKKPKLKSSGSIAKDEDSPSSSHSLSFSGSQGGEEEEEEEEDEKGGKKGAAKKKADKPMCKYGKSCYRKNPQHLKEFRHPQK